MAEEGAVINLKKLKVAELKKELSDRGLPTKGNKSDLQARLEKCLAEQGVVVSQDESEITDEHEAEDEFDHDDTDDLDDIDVNEDVAEPDVGIDVLEEQTKEKELITEDSEEEKKESQKPSSPVKKVPITPPGVVVNKDTLTEAEKKSQRLKRFGQSPPSSDTSTDKKQARAQRFGVPSPASNGAVKKSSPIVATEGVDVEKLKKRAERFGAVSPVVSKLEESDRLTKRKQRFGVSVTSSPGDSVNAKKQKRAERFGL